MLIFEKNKISILLYLSFFSLSFFVMRKIIIALVLFFIALFTSVLFAQQSKIELEIKWQWLIIGTPNNLNLGSVNAWAIIISSFLDYFWLEDLRGTSTGHYTTIQCDGLYWPNWSVTNVITWIQLSGAVIEKIAWADNDTLIYSNLNTWTDITSPKLYLYRNNAVSNVWVINRYWNKPDIRISVPSWMPAGTYKGNITYTLYDMPFSY